MSFAPWLAGRRPLVDAFTGTADPDYAVFTDTFQFDEFYAYFFLDPTQAGLGDMAVNIGALTLAFVAGALLLTGVDAAMARRAKPSR